MGFEIWILSWNHDLPGLKPKVTGFTSLSLRLLIVITGGRKSVHREVMKLYYKVCIEYLKQNFWPKVGTQKIMFIFIN